MKRLIRLNVAKIDLEGIDVKTATEIADPKTIKGTPFLIAADRIVQVRQNEDAFLTLRAAKGERRNSNYVPELSVVVKVTKLVVSTGNTTSDLDVAQTLDEIEKLVNE